MITTFAARLSEIIRGWQSVEGVIYTKILCEEWDPDLMSVHYVILSRRGTVKDAGYGKGKASGYKTGCLINEVIELQQETGIRIGQVVIEQNGHKLLIWYVDSTGRPRYHPWEDEYATSTYEMLCRQCEKFTGNEENDNGWCCEVGEAREYDDPAPEKCNLRGDEI